MSMPKNPPIQPKCSAAWAAGIDSAGTPSRRPIASAISRVGTPSSATACSDRSRRVPTRPRGGRAPRRRAGARRASGWRRRRCSPRRRSRARSRRARRRSRGRPAPCTVGANRTTTSARRGRRAPASPRRSRARGWPAGSGRSVLGRDARSGPSAGAMTSGRVACPRARRRTSRSRGRSSSRRLGHLREVVVVAEVDDAVGRRRRRRAGRRDRRGRRGGPRRRGPRPSSAEASERARPSDLVPGGEQLGDDGGADPAGRSGDEDTHGEPPGESDVTCDITTVAR